MKFLNLIVDHSRATLSIMLLILVAGAGSRLSMPVEMNPNVTLPVVMIMVQHDGISPEDGARLLIRPIEKELKPLDGLEEIQATAQESMVVVTAEFEVADNIKEIVELEREIAIAGSLDNEFLLKAKQYGFSDKQLADLTGRKEEEISVMRRSKKISPDFKLVDTCAAEFLAHTPYYYSTYDKA